MDWNRLKPQATPVRFAAVAALALVLVIGPAFGLKSYCSVEPTDNAPAYHITESREQTKNHGTERAKPNIAKAPLAEPGSNNPEKITRAKTTDYPAQVPHNFWDTLGKRLDDCWWYLFGYVHYADDLGIKRLTGFWYKFEPDGTSNAPENADFNYEY